MFAGWTERELQAFAERKAVLDRADERAASGGGAASQAEAAGVSHPTLWRLRQAWAMAQESGNMRLFLPGRPTGRPPLAQPSAEEMLKLKAIYVKTNRARGRGSKTLAARLFAQSPDCSPELREAIMKPRASKHTLTKSIRDAMEVAPQIIAHHRGPTDQKLSGIYAPGQLRKARGDEPRRLYAGERQSWDDASINFCVTVPWPWGGDRCSDRFGVKVGRFQLLAGLDDATDFCPGFSFVMREAQSYNKRDVVGAMCRTWRDDVLPAEAMLEGGSWQSVMAQEFLRAVGVALCDAKGRPHSKLVENYWNRLWSVLSLGDGQIGRYRGEMERENDLLVAAQAGRLDPREQFPGLATALQVMEAGFNWLNAEPVESKIYGKWVPQERYREDLAAHPRAALDASIAWTAAPEQHERIVRRGMVAVTAMSPIGVKFPYHFADEALLDFSGRRVRVYFDPWESPIRATFTLAEEHAGLKPGYVITHQARCLDDAPEILSEVGSQKAEGGSIEVGFDLGGLSRALQIRRAVSAAIRTEYRALGFGGRRKALLSETRGADGRLDRLECDAGATRGAATEGGGESGVKPPQSTGPRIRSRFELVSGGA